MAIKVVLFIFAIIALLAFVALAVWKFTQAATVEVRFNDDYGLTREERVNRREQAERETKLKRKAKKRLGFTFSILALCSLAFTIFVPGNIHQVDTGEVAVVRNMGKIEGVRQDGIHWDFYMTKDYVIYDTKVKQIDMETQAYTFDKQTVGLNFSMQYQIDAANVDQMARIYGDTDKVESKIEKVALDKIKAIFAKNTADQIIEDRSSIITEVKNEIDQAINPDTYFLSVKDIVLTNIDFTDDYEAAVAAKVAQKQAYEKALIEQEQALAQAENDKKVAIAKAEADAEAKKLAAEADATVAKIQAQADAEKAKIEADAAEYQGKKTAAITLQDLASTNGWTVVMETIDGKEINVLYKPDGTKVTSAELEVGSKNYLEKLKTTQWDGKNPDTVLGQNNSTIVVTP